MESICWHLVETPGMQEWEWERREVRQKRREGKYKRSVIKPAMASKHTAGCWALQNIARGVTDPQHRLFRNKTVYELDSAHVLLLIDQTCPMRLSLPFTSRSVAGSLWVSLREAGMTLSIVDAESSPLLCILETRPKPRCTSEVGVCRDNDGRRWAGSVSVGFMSTWKLWATVDQLWQRKEAQGQGPGDWHHCTHWCATDWAAYTVCSRLAILGVMMGALSPSFLLWGQSKAGFWAPTPQFASGASECKRQRLPRNHSGEGEAAWEATSTSRGCSIRCPASAVSVPVVAVSACDELVVLWNFGCHF